MDKLREQLSGIAHLAAEAAAETLWPTRCAVCDRPGKVLCERCASTLPCVDWWQACRRCGSPYGLVQCDACNSVALARLGRSELPYASCASAMEFGDAVGRVVRVYKDQGEQRLAGVIAERMARVLPPSWEFEAITFVPATLAAYRYRGFDHAELISRELACMLGVPCEGLLERPCTRDQRNLTGKQRISNLAGSFQAVRYRADGEVGFGAVMPRRALLIDDVYTTGATLCAASDALIAAGVREVSCLTFARV